MEMVKEVGKVEEVIFLSLPPYLSFPLFFLLYFCPLLSLCLSFIRACLSAQCVFISLSPFLLPAFSLSLSCTPVSECSE